MEEATSITLIFPTRGTVLIILDNLRAHKEDSNIKRKALILMVRINTNLLSNSKVARFLEEDPLKTSQIGEETRAEATRISITIILAATIITKLGTTTLEVERETSVVVEVAI